MSGGTEAPSKARAAAGEQNARSKGEDLPIQLIVPFPANRPSSRTGFAPLQASIAEQGLLQPIVVRPKGPGYEIVAGERRWRACQALKHPSIQAIVRDLTDEQAAVLRLVENLQRQDLTPLEEGEALAAALAAGLNATQLAEQTGLAAARISRRVRLAKLASPWRKELAQATPRWPVGAYELIAALPVTTQEALHKAGLHWMHTIRDLQEHINSTHLRDLAKAPWKLEDAELVRAVGACAVCPKRSTAAPDLFTGPPRGKPGLCLDAECFAAKLAATQQRAVQAHLEKEPELPVVYDWERKEKDVRALVGPKAKLIPASVGVCEARKDTPGAIRVLKIGAQEVRLCFVSLDTGRGRPAAPGFQAKARKVSGAEKAQRTRIAAVRKQIEGWDAKARKALNDRCMGRLLTLTHAFRATDGQEVHNAYSLRGPGYGDRRVAWPARAQTANSNVAMRCWQQLQKTWAACLTSCGHEYVRDQDELARYLVKTLALTGIPGGVMPAKPARAKKRHRPRTVRKSKSRPPRKLSRAGKLRVAK